MRSSLGRNGSAGRRLSQQKTALCLLATIVVAFCPGSAWPEDARISRRDFQVSGEPGIRLFVREVREQEGPAGRPIVLIHGARVPGLASFDLPVAGGSPAADLALRGFDVYIMDVRGYGRSTRPREMDEPVSAHPVLVRSNEAARDIGSVVDWIRLRRKLSQVGAVRLGDGGQWAGYYASLYPEKISALILLNSLYGGSFAHSMVGHGSDLEDPAHPGRFNRAACGAYNFSDQKPLFRAWDRSIPVEDKSSWRDPAVTKAYAEAALATDPSSHTRTPPSFRAPCGALEDSFYLATGRQLWDASLITAPTLILAAERDFWSRPDDRELLQQQLVHTVREKVVVLPNATHFVH